MFDISLLNNLPNSLIKIKNIRSQNAIKKTHNPLFSSLFVYLIELEHPLKALNKRKQV